MLKATELKRLHVAACRDKTPERFFEEFQEGLDSGAVTLEDVSLRELAHSFIEDGYEMVSSWNPANGGSGEKSYASIMEEAGAVTAGGFSRISGQLVITRVLDAYRGEDSTFSDIIGVTPTQFNGEKLTGLSRMGDMAETVPEGRAYPMAGISEDYIETPATTKKGLKVAITKEAVFFDRTGVIEQRCGEVGIYLALNKEKRVIDCVVDENTTAARYKWKGTSYATYQATTPYINLKATNTLVDWTNIDAAELVANQLTDPYTGEPIMLDFKHLVVTRNLLRTAQRIVTATGVQTVSPGYATSGNPNQVNWSGPKMPYSIVWSAQLAARMATKTSWFIGDLKKAFTYMQNWPITVVQAPANSMDEFNLDIVAQWKASERGTAATLDPRYVIKSTVA